MLGQLALQFNHFYTEFSLKKIDYSETTHVFKCVNPERYKLLNSQILLFLRSSQYDLASQ